jgi:hypothetical protein
MNLSIVFISFHFHFGFLLWQLIHQPIVNSANCFESHMFQQVHDKSDIQSPTVTMRMIKIQKSGSYEYEPTSQDFSRVKTE